MKRRPENWENPHPKVWNPEDYDVYRAYEAGADAIIEKSPGISLNLTTMLASQVGMAILGSCPYTKVKLIFISEDEDE